MPFIAKPYTIKLSTEEAERLNAILADESIDTMRDAICILIEKSQQSITASDATPLIPVTETEEYQKLLSAYQCLESENIELGVKLTAITENLEAYEQASDKHESTALSENSFIVELDAQTGKILSETCEKLSDAAEQYPQLKDFAGVTPGVLLVSMFRRYVKERLTEWFFPLGVMPEKRINEIEEEL